MEIQAREKKEKRHGIHDQILSALRNFRKTAIVSWGTAGKVALAIWIAVTLAELFVLWRIHKKGGCTDEKISRPARESGRE